MPHCHPLTASEASQRINRSAQSHYTMKNALHHCFCGIVGGSGVYCTRLWYTLHAPAHINTMVCVIIVMFDTTDTSVIPVTSVTSVSVTRIQTMEQVTWG